MTHAVPPKEIRVELYWAIALVICLIDWVAFSWLELAPRLWTPPLFVALWWSQARSIRRGEGLAITGFLLVAVPVMIEDRATAARESLRIALWGLSVVAYIGVTVWIGRLKRPPEPARVFSDEEQGQ